MAHYRTRFAEKILKKDMSFSPCVAVLGMRQVGKSTLLKRLSQNYQTFDNDSFLGEFQRNKHAILTTPPFPLALDEIQKYPPAFDALKLAIDNHKIPGRYIVSGSVRFSSRKQIRESLTGRMVSINLLPLSLAECNHHSLSSFIDEAFTKTPTSLAKSISRKAWANESHVLKLASHGGMPGICFHRDPIVRQRYFTAHLDTLLGRDIQLVRKTNLSIPKLLNLLQQIAQNEGEPINMKKWARVVNASAPTVKSTLDALEGLFLIRRYGSGLYLEDLGLAHFLSQNSSHLSRLFMIKMLFHEFRTQIGFSSHPNLTMTPYQTRGGGHVPFVFKSSDGGLLAIGIDDEDTPSEKSLKSLTWFCKRYPKAKTLILCRRSEPITTLGGVLCLPWTWVY